MACLARNLTRAAGALASRFHAKATTATIRDHLIEVPARLSTSARRRTWHLPTDWHTEPAWQALFAAVAHETRILGTVRLAGQTPWVLLVIGSAASLSANVAVAEPSAVGRLIAAWPSAALIGSYELLMRQIRQASGPSTSGQPRCFIRGFYGSDLGRRSLIQNFRRTSYGPGSGRRCVIRRSYARERVLGRLIRGSDERCRAIHTSFLRTGCKA